MKINKLTKKSKMIIGMVISAVVVIGGVCWGATAYATEQEEQQQLTNYEKKVTQAGEQVDALYLDGSKELLAKDISKEKIITADKALDDLKGSSLYTKEVAKEVKEIVVDWSYADYMYDYQLNVEKLFDQNKALSEDANIKQVEEQRKDLIKNTKKETFAKTLDPLLKEAVAQQAQIDNATKQVNDLYTSSERKEVKDNITWTAYNSAKTSVDKVKQVKAKENLTNGLKKANDSLKAQDVEKEAQAQVQAETQAEAEQQAIANEFSGNESSSNEGSSSNKKATNDSSASSSSNSSSDSSSNNSKSGSSSNNSSGNSKASGGSSSKSNKGSSSSNNKSSSNNSNGSTSKSNGGKSGGSTNYNTDDYKDNGSEKNKSNGGTNEYWGWE
ncbi:TPA: hypothetical protein RFK82_000875 [Listeria monocytogenes]|uniref:toxin Cry1Ac domain D-VI-related protein n=1 Tax=Listeria seeligeri TaxID=1640 RepID=UPI0016268A23|nr:toxin Cry1Ac domain D-VI-related protein [Listeria seeligeri]HAO6496191.1 hypothetical protein [Listeria monocytogenes]MBC1540588.1 hypothetical protein [Listeria seeligeri]MBC1581601.1 hypothetical protein [Listeria seeligeri]MBC1736598.1 hypothetical protein [Listeria seeligeri]MBC2208757.1 hypothetical protein [Listeria seeligeri]